MMRQERRIIAMTNSLRKKFPKLPEVTSERMMRTLRDEAKHYFEGHHSPICARERERRERNGACARESNYLFPKRKGSFLSLAAASSR